MEILLGVHHRLQTQPCTFRSHYLLQVQQLPRHTWLVRKGTETVQVIYKKVLSQQQTLGKLQAVNWINYENQRSPSLLHAVSIQQISYLQITIDIYN
jgi:hypothetical protein